MRQIRLRRRTGPLPTVVDTRCQATTTAGNRAWLPASDGNAAVRHPPGAATSAASLMGRGKRRAGSPRQLPSR